MKLDDTTRELLILYAYEELPLDQEQKLRARLQSEPELQAELDQLRKDLELVTAHAPRASEPLLWQARQELNRVLPHEKAEKPPHRRAGLVDSRKWVLLRSFFRPAQAVAAVLLLAAGIAIGFLVFAILGPTPTELQAVDPFTQPGLKISAVHFLELDPESGRVSLDFEASRTYRVTGSMEDEMIRRFLSHTLVSERNPAVRLRAVSTIANQKVLAPDKEILSALIGALKTDNNVAVRREALLALRKYPMNPSIKTALLDALRYDTNAGIRIEVIKRLESMASGNTTLDSEILEVLREKVNNDQNDFVKGRARLVLEDSGSDYF